LISPHSQLGTTGIPNHRATKRRPEAALRAKVEDYLRESSAFELLRQRAITADETQAETERMTRQTRLPAVFDELWAAFGRDPFVIDAMPGAANAGRASAANEACGLRVGE
jgi:hypothetical protein